MAAVVDMYSPNNKILLAIADTIHDMWDGYRGKKGEGAAAESAVDYFRTYLLRFLKSRYSDRLNAACQGNIEMPAFLQNCINDLHHPRHITPSDIEKSTVAYFETHTSLKDKTLQLNLTYDQIIAAATAGGADLGALHMQVEGANSIAITGDIPEENTAAAITSRKHIAEFIELYLYGTDTNNLLITFDASQTGIAAIFGAHPRARQLIMPQNIGDSASTSFDMLGNNPFYYFPIQGAQNGSKRFVSQRNTFSQGQFSIYYEEQILPSIIGPLSFSQNHRYGFSFHIEKTIPPVDPQVKSTSHFSKDHNQGPSLNYLLELHLVAADNNNNKNLSTIRSGTKSQIPIGLHIQSNANLRTAILNQTRLAGHNAANPPSAVLIDIKRDGDGSQIDGAKRTQLEVDAAAAAAAATKVIVATGDLLCATAGRLHDGNGNGADNTGQNCILQLPGKKLIVYRAQSNQPQRDARDRALAQQCMTLITLYTNLINGTRFWTNLGRFAQSIYDQFILLPGELEIYTFIRRINKIDIYQYLYTFIMLNPHFGITQDQLHEMQAIYTAFNGLDQMAQAPSEAEKAEKRGYLDRLQTTVNSVQEHYRNHEYTPDFLYNIINMFKQPAADAVPTAFNQNINYPFLNYDPNNYIRLKAAIIEITSLIDPHHPDVLAAINAGTLDRIEPVRGRPRYVASEFTTPVDDFNDIMNEIFETFQSTTTYRIANYPGIPTEPDPNGGQGQRQKVATRLNTYLSKAKLFIDTSSYDQDGSCLRGQAIRYLSIELSNINRLLDVSEWPGILLDHVIRHTQPIVVAASSASASASSASASAAAQQHLVPQPMEVAPAEASAAAAQQRIPLASLNILKYKQQQLAEQLQRAAIQSRNQHLADRNKQSAQDNKLRTRAIYAQYAQARQERARRRGRQVFESDGGAIGEENETHENIKKLKPSPYLHYLEFKWMSSQAATWLRSIVSDVKFPIIHYNILYTELIGAHHELLHKNYAFMINHAKTSLTMCGSDKNLEPLKKILEQLIQSSGVAQSDEPLKNQISNLKLVLDKVYETQRDTIMKTIYQTVNVSTMIRNFYEMKQRWDMEMLTHEPQSNGVSSLFEDIDDDHYLSTMISFALISDELDGMIENDRSVPAKVVGYVPEQKIDRTMPFEKIVEHLHGIIEKIDDRIYEINDSQPHLNESATTNANVLVPANPHVNIPRYVEVGYQRTGGNRTRKHRGHKTQRKKHGARKTKSKRRFGTQRKKQNRK